MKIFLDDERSTPEGWIRCFWPEEVITILQQDSVEIISLDHDLGDDNRGTGYDVILWIEEQVFTNNYIPPRILVHSANSSAAQKMNNGIRTIENYVRDNLSVG